MRRRKTIALVLDYLGGDYQLGLLAPIEEAARERDVNLIVAVGRALACPNPVDAVQNDIYARLGAARVDGLIVGSGCIGIHIDTAALRAFVGRFEHLAKCSISAQLPGIPSLVVSNRRGMRTIVEHVITAHGRRRVACIRGPMGGDEAQERFEGYRLALQHHGIAFDPDLVEAGDFWIQSGGRAMGRLLDGGKRFDAVVVANDYMALGAVDVLRNRRVRIPGEIVVTGFDDVPSARIAYPSLSTVRQPLLQLGRLAVDTVMRQLEGESVPDVLELDVELVARQSCGCDHRVAAKGHRSPPPGALRTARDEIDQHGAALRNALLACVPNPPPNLEGWAHALIEALRTELEGPSGRFLVELEETLDRAQTRGDVIQQFNAVITTLRAHFRGVPLDARHSRTMEDLWHAALLVVGAAANRNQLRTAFESEHAQDLLRGSVERLTTALSHPALLEGLREVFPALGVRNAAISLYADESREQLRGFLVWVDGSDQTPADLVFSSSQLAPDLLLGDKRRWAYFLMPLTFGSEHLGLALIDMNVHVSVPRALREHIGAALKGAMQHHAVVREAALRERAEREQLKKETEIAERIQMAILPTAIRADGLDVAALMIPAADVGGDYYDVLPAPGGCWIAIGDVTGHGLLAGLVSLMIQGMVAGMAAVSAGGRPRDLVVALNRALYDNVRHRLQRDDQATLLLIRYDRDGTLVFAGYHEEILVCRARTGRCERIPTTGVWLAATPDVDRLTVDSRAVLENGDLFVLYTDGVTEAMNSHREQFGVERLCTAIELHRARPVKEICAALADTVRQWSPLQADDVSLLAARYAAPAGPPAG